MRPTRPVGIREDEGPPRFADAERDGGDGGAKHRQMFKDAGVAALLFGAGAGCNTSYQNDTWTDGQLFLKTHVATYYQNPLALP